MLKIGVLALQGGVVEHINATAGAAKALGKACEITQIKYKHQFESIDALIIPGGESTVLHKLCERNDIFEEIKNVKNIFGTCAGAIMLAKKIKHELAAQKTLELMDIEADRNAYGTQTESFEHEIETKLGRINAVFIRAPKIRIIGNTKVLAELNGETIACSQKSNGKFYMATAFHPELSTTKFHEYFLREILHG